MVTRAKALKRPIRGLYLFCTRQGKPYSDTGFKAMWNRVQVKWAESGGQRFTFHDIRAKALTDAKRLGLDALVISRTRFISNDRALYKTKRLQTCNLFKVTKLKALVC